MRSGPVHGAGVGVDVEVKNAVLREGRHVAASNRPKARFLEEGMAATVYDKFRLDTCSIIQVVFFNGGPKND